MRHNPPLPEHMQHDDLREIAQYLSERFAHETRRTGEFDHFLNFIDDVCNMTAHRCDPNSRECRDLIDAANQIRNVTKDAAESAGYEVDAHYPYSFTTPRQR
ncbi:MAG: hypothetical protein EBT03_09655 [Betaproteobacteria bacterium]|jgi:hypothetical protein|nr:hypothetical protein [Betaproteobacteria bacterium]NCA16903.1 hypothetical protein [Betaproteobacteria bacterium]